MMMHNNKTHRAQRAKNKKGGLRFTVYGLLLVACCLPITAAAQEPESQHVTVGGNVYGGGNLAAVTGSTTVLLDQENAVVTGDVYGGGALASTGATNVTLMQGTVTGDVYGGGLGRKEVTEYVNPNDATDIIVPAVTGIPAAVNGDVHVKIGNGTYDAGVTGRATDVTGSATIGGSVYGCNNLNGSPTGDVYVDIYQTAHTTANTYPDITTIEALRAASVGNTEAYADTFAIKAVYGGGNQAAYTAAGKTATVHIYTCSNTIQTVYGGGNAADATNVHLIVEGGRFDQVFGGGNGYSASRNHTMPYDDGTGTCTATPSTTACADYNPGADVSESATTDIHGGLYRQLFGGSNQYGDVANASLTIDHASGCTELILESFGGANEADMNGSVTTNLLCSDILIGTFYGGSNMADINGNVTLNVYGGIYENVFGGSKGVLNGIAADIDGDVTLNLFGGTMTNAFGGSDANGNITGNITVNMLDFETTNCGLQVNNIYGGGNQTAYTPDDITPGVKPASPTVNIIHGTVSKDGSGNYGNVFGGGYGDGATVTANPVVNIGYDASVMGTLADNNSDIYKLVHSSNTYTPAVADPSNYQATVESSVYGSGYAASVTGNTTVVMTKANSNASKLFGGGANAGVTGNTSVTLTDGTVLDGIFGGSDTTGTITGNTAIALNGGSVGTNVHSAVYDVCGGGWGLETRVGGNVSLTLNGTYVYGNLYGGSYYGDVNTNSSNTTVVTLTSGTVTENVYGGGFGDRIENAYALVNGAVTVNANGATVIGDIFGCNNDNGEPKSTVAVNFTGGSAKGVYGGGKFADYEGIPVITITGGTITNRVVGGGEAASVGGSNISISGGTIATEIDQPGCGVFGGCFTSGEVDGAITVSVTGGTIGTDATHRANIHGGGYGDETSSTGNVTVTFGNSNASHQNTPVLYGDLYGGSGFGNVNESTSNTTTVNVLNGEITGDVYGGGLGQKGDDSDPENIIPAYPALVNGNVVVNIGESTSTGKVKFNTYDGGNKGGRVFGANNANGTPKGNVAVNIYATDHGSGIANNEYPLPYGTISTAEALATNAATQTYAIAAVFGGGNEASYTPVADKRATVHVYNCNNTIKDVYGGGNAANVGTTGEGAIPANTYVVIDGGRIHRVFGGGNGEVTPAHTYGTATTTVNAGLIDQVFGCGNMDGSITATDLQLLKTGSCSDEVWGEVFGGANQAAFAGNLSTTIGCGVGTIGDIYGGSNKARIDGNVTLTIKGGSYTNIFGGSKGVRASGLILDTAANISGKVTLNLHGGTITNAFGGSNQNGNIGDSIIVNVLDFKTTCPLNITNIYGGGNETPYTPTSSSITSPIVNVMHIAQSGGILGSVYGGGKGATAIVTANPKVTIGYDASTMSQYTDGHTVSADTLVAYVTGNVYGGGDAAAVTGNTTVKMYKSNSQVTKLFGGGNQAGVSGATDVTLDGGTVTGGVYGGCNESGSVGAITMALNGGAVGTNSVNANVFGGGFGHGTSTTSNIDITLDGTIVYGDLYGGSALGSVNGSTDHTTTITVSSNTLHGTIYGGGEGSGTDADHRATSNGNIVINYNSENTNLVGGIYGGANINGAVTGDINVNVNANVGASGDGNRRDIFGGGLGQRTATDGNTTVTVGASGSPVIYGDLYGGSSLGEVGASDKTSKVDLKGGTLNGTIYGGGKGDNSTVAMVSGGSEASVSGGTVSGGVYGGCNVNGTVTQTSAVNITGGTIGADGATANVYGGGLGANTKVKGDIDVTINGNSAIIWGDVYGGSAKGLVNYNDAGNARTPEATTDVTLTAGTIHGSLYGGGHGIDAAAAHVWGPVQVTVNGGTVTNEIYGCNNAAGTPQSTVHVDIYGTDQPGSGYALSKVFGGGNQANYAGTPVVKVHNCDNKIEYVYGGGNAATVSGTDVTIYGGNTIGNVYGGCYGANVSGNTLVNIYGGVIDNVFGGNNASGAISGTITVNINSVADADPNGSSTACNMNARNVFGGGNVAAYSGTPDVNILGGTAGNVFGGGNLATVNGTDVDMTGGTVAKIYGGGNEAGVTTSTDVNISGGLVTNGIYGGCNTTGTVGTTSTIALLGGQVGTNAVRADICGGGYGQPTNVDGNVHIIMGNADSTATPIIYGNLYGGSALGNVNTNSSHVNVGTNDYLNETNTTTIDLLSGTFTGNVFGGGLGRQAVAAVGSPEDPEYVPAVTAVAALVHGVVQINVGRNTGTNESPVYTGAANLKNASIYGCNNVNGSPQNDVHIDIYSTAHPEHTLVTDLDNLRSYAIANVYGGGNRANYEPKYNTPYSTSEWNLMKLIHVHVHGCDNTIGEFFGGGNAADVDGDSVIIDGGRFNELFGGGNGAAKAANIGKGGIHLEVKAGRVGYLFEECNRRGNLASGAPKHYKHGGGSCNDGILQIDYHFCGGNIQDVIGDSVYTFTCAKNVRYVGLYGGCRLGCHYGNITLVIEGGTIQEVYGGSQGSLDYSADVRKYPKYSDVVANPDDYPAGMKTFLEDPEHAGLEGTGGNVTVIIKGGKIGSVFGGCNTRGNVEGRITIIIDSTESDACPLDLDYVYGGGNLAAYEPDTITTESGDPYPYPHIELTKGHVNFDVFGGGHGADSNLTAGLVTANPHIVMAPEDDKFWVKGNIYGGGEMGSVGDYTRDGNGKPTACTANTGNTTIAISAGRVGPSTLTMPTFKGHVFGGSKGTVGDTSAITGQPLISHLAYVNNTDITISGTAFIKGSVYGGGESGRVFHDTYVKIQGGQIGCGEGQTGPYSDGQFINPHTTPVTNENALAECNHWAYGDGNTPKKYDPYDPYEHTTAHDGHTFYGNVFGGGSGMMPYKSRNKANTADSSIYIQTSGRVLGNTKVEVTGGHVLTSIYGGCELGDVTGNSCVVTFGGSATLGVPRTLAQIADHPVTCYLFGAGKGDERVRFNTCTNVENVRVTVDGGTIYGSVFGGGEDGHVMKNVKVEIKSGAKIGTWGTSYVDGNVFGGGRGFSGNALTAGNVGGDVEVNITGGTMLGSIYGGGRLASVGYGLYPATDENYGKIQPDGKHDDGSTWKDGSGDDVPRGHITVDIRGNAIIGNDNVNKNGTLDYLSEHPYGGNVFGGSMGRLVKMDDSYILDLWSKLGCAKQTTVNISGTAQIKSNVYGGSELGSVTENTKVSISGTPTIGRLVSSTRYHGNVYGGGYGSVELTAGQLADQARRDSTFIYAGRTYGNTQIDITGGTLYGTVYGGGEMAYIGDENDATKGNTLVNIGLPGNDPTDASLATGSATIHGEVYGANNINGTPFGSTAVHIYKTAHSGTNSYPSPAPADAAAMAAATSQTYALSAVYGGGNKAEHAPIADDGTTLVYVHYCDENTIDEVYGGGNAANTKNNSVIIDGGRIHSVFGGGNGYSAAKNHDNPSAPNYNPGAAASGIATTAIHGGLIDTVYGGSNQYGYINQINLIIDHIRADDGDPECTQIVGGLFGAGNESFGGGGEVTIACGTGYFSEVYGGANMADIGTALNPSYITLNVQGGTLDKVFGGSKGDLASLGAGHTDRPANIYGDITVNVTGGTIGYVYGGSNYNGNITGSITVNIDSTQAACPLTISDNVYGASYITMYQPTDRDIESPVVNIKHGTVGGSVFGAGDGQGARVLSNPAVYMGNGDYTNGIDDPATTAVESEPIALKPVVKGNIYGGGNAARVFGHTRVDMLDGTVDGSIYAASKGKTYAELLADAEKETRAIVDGWTTLNMSGGLVKDCLYGGGELGQVGHLDKEWSKYSSETTENKAKYGNAYVNMTGGTVGAEGAAATHGNIYGSGKGNTESPITGRVQGNTFVTITDGLVRHNVYGGGSMASVGTFTYDDDKTAPGYHSQPAQQILSCASGTGTATVYIAGGTIGTDGHENGMVFGSSRGDIDTILARQDTMAWAYATKVTIGDTTAAHNMTSPQIKGSVYGGGENGHVKQNAYVHIYSGQVGYQSDIAGDNKGDIDKEDPTYAFRGNVYGAGCGTDKFFIKDSVAQLKIGGTIKHLEKKAAGGGHHDPDACTPANDSIFKVYDYNMYAGVVQGNSHIKISGGHIFHNVYGGGAMGNVGSISSLTQHRDSTHSFALSYPNEFVFAGETGYAHIDITGGRIGTMGSYDGDVFGGARGEAGDRYKMARYGNVRTAVITINYPTTVSPELALDTFDVSECITGSVYGGGENGHINDSTFITLTNGLVGHALYGGGKGKGTYTSHNLKYQKNNADGIHLAGDDSVASIYSLTAGKVYGNTRVVMNGGHVVRNIFGGGNQGSIGKGNYYGGLGDYNNAIGYGELLSNAADTAAFLPLFRSSGTTTVIVNDGTVGMPSGDKDNLPIGNVFGGARGSAPPDIDSRLTPRILYYPTFFSGYVNRTRVTIGDGTHTPRIYGSVYGGGMDGHVRWDSYVRVRSGEIGNPYISSADAITLVGTDNLDHLEWKLRGNVYGSGSGLGLYDSDGDGTDDAMSYSSGSVTQFTKVDIEGGTIHRNVYGGGSLATVGPPNIPASKPDATLAQTLAQVNIKGGTIGSLTDAPQGYGGNVFGGSRGQIGVDNATFSTVIYSEVNVSDGQVYASVYGGGEIGSIKQDTKVTISGGTIGDTTYYNDSVGFYNDEEHAPFPAFLGHVYGAGKGIADESAEMQYKTFNNVDSTEVIVSGGRIYGSVFGGSANGHVKGSTDVNVSDGTIGTKGVSSWDGYLFGGGEGSGHAVYIDANDNGIDDDNEYDHYVLHTHCGRVGGNNSITVSGGYFYGSIYGGGRLALTGVDVDGNYSTFVDEEGVYDSVHHGQVTINISGNPVIGNANADTLLASDFSVGDIFGSGRGDVDYYESVPAGRVANAHVNVSGTPVIHGAIFGGGEMAGVGYWSDAAGHPFAGQTGTTVVNVSGGTIGTPLEYTKAYLDAHIDDTTDWTLIVDGKVNHACTGNIIGGSQGDIDIKCPAWISMGRSRQTYVSISDTARIMGNVYGGAEQGVVTGNTHVEVSGGTIGTTINVADSVAPKGHYHYGSVFGGGYGTEKFWKHENDSCIYDGSGEIKAYTSGSMIAGRVYGNTNVKVTGGNIYENVYGGGNMASVGYVDRYYHTTGDSLVIEYLHDSTKWHNGVCTVTIGGTAVIGSAGLDGTEMNGEVYGAGKGVGNDPDEHFKTYCNVNSTDLTVDGGFINGSTFGGGADCHVLGHTNTLIKAGANIGSGKIVNTPRGYDGYEEEYDGCVIGGGRNALNVNHTAGRVQGNTYVKVTGGRIKRSVIGGGALARTGVDVNGLIDSLKAGDIYDSTHHGSTFVDVSGLTDTINFSNYAPATTHRLYAGTVDTFTVAGVKKVVLYHTTLGAPDGPILVDNDYTIGDIFGGGKGDTKDTVDILAGKVMNTYVKVHGYPRIMADVYAGGEMSCVGWYDTTGAKTGVYYPRSGYTHVEISDDPRTGTPYEFSCANIHYGRPWTLIDSVGRLYHTCSGNVYGGGQGYVEEDGTHRWNWVQMGRVYQTEVKIHGGHFMGNVFGGGSRGIVKKDCHVTITGGTFGNHIVDDTTIYDTTFVIDSIFSNTPEPHTFVRLDTIRVDHIDTLVFNNRYNYGSIFGGGYGNHKTFWHYNDSCFVKGDGTHKGDTIFMQPLEFAGRVYGNTYVTITGGHIMDCVFGGGDMASTGWVERDANGVYLFNDPTKRHGGKCTVNISGNTMVGPLDYFGHNAYVYGAGRGVGYDPTEEFKTYSNINKAELTVALREGPSADPAKGPSQWDTTTMGGRIWGSLFGGGADSHVLGDVSTTVNSGVIGTDGSTSYDGNIFGGGRNYLHTNSTNGRVQGNITVTVTHGTLRGSIFGGGRLAMAGIDTAGNYPTTNWDSADHGNVTINVNTADGTVSIGNNNSRTLLQSDESNGDIFGSGKGDTKDYELVWAGQVANVYINVTGSPTIYGSIFGGGEMASLGYWDNTSAFIDGTGYAHIIVGDDDPSATDNPVIGTADEYNYNVYTDSTNPGEWTIYDDAGVLVHGCTGNIFGGCQGDVDLESPKWVTLARGRAAEVTVNHGTIMGSVFGAAEQGVMTGNTRVTINGGTIAANVPANALANFGVYGGGYGSDDPADNIESYNDSTDARILLGLPYTADYMAGRLFGNATVNILGGTVKGNVYGGGQMAYIGDDKPTASRSAIPGVNGATLVNIGKESQVGHIDQGPTIEGEIFGANNLMGSPYGNTEVHIYSTAHTLTDTCPKAGYTKALAVPDTALTEEDVNALPYNDNNFALKAVYGGGNHAAHTPLATDGTTNVYVHYCDENTIRDVYGGGNAADTKNNHIVIEGGRIYEVFGGGNGYSSTGNHTQPYILDGSGDTTDVPDPNYNPGADVSGTAWTEIKGGLITDVFGGSNSRGNVGNILLDIEKEGTCEMMVANTYGGGNEADGGGGVINLYCGTNAGNFYGGSRNANLTGDIVLNIFGGTYENVFGGSKGRAAVAADPEHGIEAVPVNPANITGNVTVNVFGGNIQNLYGGSDICGNITGKITVNIDLDSNYNCPDGLRLNKVYGAGNLAVYFPDDPTLASPEINIINDTATYTTVDNTDPSNPVVTVTKKSFGIRTVFGGGFGDGTTHSYYTKKPSDGVDTLRGQVFANPVVNIGGIEQKWDKTQPGTGTAENPFGALVVDDWRINRASIRGNVYGGGEAAPVTGSPMVTLHSSRITKVTGTAPNLDTTFALKNHDTTYVCGSVFGGGYGPTAVVDGNTTVGIFGDATVINGNVYGGGEAAILTGSTDVQVGYERIYITQLPQFTVTEDPDHTGKYRVEIYTATPGATLYYTLDGTDPTTSSIVYSERLTNIEPGTTVKALAVKPGYAPAVPAVTKVAQP